MGTQPNIAMNNHTPSISNAFQNVKYNYGECLQAIRGIKLPANLGSRIARICAVRGIRHHAAFATIAKILHGLPECPEITRALNARSIMSNVIPEMSNPNDVPYCIWHPDLATESTYRSLASKYPHMRYHVGRACAVAGYTVLYDELNLLPDVAIAEEARSNVSGGRPIFDAIMTRRTKYAIMNDYDRTIDLKNPRVSSLNADTATRPSLDLTQRLDEHENVAIIQTHYFNITEDWLVAEHDHGHTADRLTYKEASLLYTPLPADLPNDRKDILILLAAYNGDIDRYARLARPRHVRHEVSCIIRGIYHNTMFAKWWSIQSNRHRSPKIEAAINARFIMNNDLSRLSKDTPEEHLPYLIYYPGWASSVCYEQLAHRKPSMKPQILRAAVIQNDQDLFDRIFPDVNPDYFLVREARVGKNPYYLDKLISKATALDIDVVTPPYMDEWKSQTRAAEMEHSSTFLSSSISLQSVHSDLEASHIYNGIMADVSEIELFVCSPKDLIPGEGSEIVDVGDAYHQASNPNNERKELR